VLKEPLKFFNELPFVEYAEPDYVLHADTNDTYFYYQWGLHNTGQRIRYTSGYFDADIDAPEAWDTTTGEPTFVVAVIDTGVDYNHEDLEENIWDNPEETPNDNQDNDGNNLIDDVHGWDFFSNDNNPMDEEGHGTHVAGTICAKGNNGIGVSGIAWQYKIMTLRFLGPNGGLTSDAIAALNYAVDKGVRVSNNSWGGGGYSTSLKNAIANAGSAGHLFVAAAGNGGSDGIGNNTDISPHYPSSYDLDNIISVAATDNRDRLASFSNFGTTSVDLGAPGVDIASTMLSGYYWSSGTSMATPHVTGVAALIFGLHPEFSNLEVKDLLLNTARPIAALNGKTLTGGVVNAYDAALTAGESSTTTTLPPTTTTTLPPTTTTTLPPTTTTTLPPTTTTTLPPTTTTTLPPTTTTTLPPITCADITDKVTCIAEAACEWAGNPTIGQCYDPNDVTDCGYSDKKSCETGGCTWDNKNKVCLQ
jgi:subtilisin family serine protease